MQAQRFRMQANGLLVGFGLQFVFGMVLNLFIELPKTHPGTSGTYVAQLWNGFVWSLTLGGGWTLFVHVLIGLGLFLGCLSLFIRALIARDRLWGWVGGIAALFTFGALLSGLDFVSRNDDKSSLAMAIAWLVGVGILVFGVAKSSKSSTVTLGS